MKISNVVKNTFMLYVMSIAKMLFPLLTLPYLTRVLSEDMYGFVAYVKSCMTYMQLIVDFGFILSSVKEIVKANGDKDRIGHIVGNTVVSKLLLSIVAASVLSIMWMCIDILQMDTLFVSLSFVSVITTAFLADFLFRGIEKMHYITYIYLVSKAVSVILTFLVVKDDKTVLWVPVLDIISNLLSVLISIVIVRKLEIVIKTDGLAKCINMIRESFIYFLSNVSTTAFTALNTLLIGIYITDLKEVAHWSICLSLITTIQGLYAPICNGIYPYMIKEKSIKFVHKVLLVVMPVVVMGCVFSYFMAETVLMIVGGEKYVEACYLFRWMIPILLFSFPAQLYGWPTLGAIGKERETTATTIFAAVVQIIGLILLVIFNSFTVVALAMLRSATEVLFMVARMFVTYKNRKYFVIAK